MTDHLLPLLRPHLVGAALLAFVAGIGNFGIPALLGAPVNYLTLPVLIYRRLSSFGTGIFGDVAALGLLVAVIAIVCVAASQLLTRRGEVHLEEDVPLQPFWHLGRAGAAAEVLRRLVIAVTLILPMLSLLTAALVPSYGMPLTAFDDHPRQFRRGAGAAGRDGAGLPELTALCRRRGLPARVLSIPVAYGLVRLMGPARILATALLEISYVLPGIVLAIACILLFLKPLPLVGVSLYATPWIIVFAYLARFLPVALKPALAAWGRSTWRRRKPPPSTAPASRAGSSTSSALAASGRRGWRVDGVPARLQRAHRLGPALVGRDGNDRRGALQPRRGGARGPGLRGRRVIVAVVTLAMLVLDALGQVSPGGGPALALRRGRRCAECQAGRASPMADHSATAFGTVSRRPVLKP